MTNSKHTCYATSTWYLVPVLLLLLPIFYIAKHFFFQEKKIFFSAKSAFVQQRLFLFQCTIVDDGELLWLSLLSFNGNDSDTNDASSPGPLLSHDTSSGLISWKLGAFSCNCYN